jgi:predicted nucleic acid-binding protein
MSLLIDTNVLSELARPRPDRRVIEWASELAAVTLSAITVEEIFFGLAAKPNARIERWFEGFLETDCQVLEVTAPIARHAGVLRGQLAKRGRPRSQADMLIAATAALHGLTLATRNQRDFADCGVSVHNPFASIAASLVARVTRSSTPAAARSGSRSSGRQSPSRS